MKKRVLMSLVVLAIIGTSAVFAQQPTLDKLKWGIITGNSSSSNRTQIVNPANTSISGALVIPGTYNGYPTRSADFAGIKQITSLIILDGAANIANNGFDGCTGLTSVTLPAGIGIGNDAFRNCTDLTSITLGANLSIGAAAFRNIGDVQAKYNAGGAGTYTRQPGGTVWTKQGGRPDPVEYCPTCGQPLPKKR